MSRSVVSFVFVALISMMILGSNKTNGQSIGSKYGKDSIKCVTNIALYREFYKQKNYKDAIIPWRYVFINCPKATENIFINGANMYNSFIAVEKDCATRQRLIDTLLLIYDVRTKYWGNEGKQLANKANDLLTADTSRSFEAYGMLKRSIELLKNTTEESTLRNYCSAAIRCFTSGNISSDAIIELYHQSEMIIDAQVSLSKENTERQRWNDLKRVIEVNIFPLLQCKDITAIFTLKLMAKPDDVALLEKVSEILINRGCTDDSLSLNTLEKMNVLAPDVNTAFLIAREYLKRKDVVKAVETLNSVADRLKDDDSKARCAYYLAAVYTDAKDFNNARTNALKALQLKADYGEAYVLIAQCYAQSALICGKDNIGSRAAFWCAVDRLSQAKEIDPKLESSVNNLINRYSRNFPTKEMLLAAKLKVGSKYLVECWINETTTVRSNTGIK